MNRDELVKQLCDAEFIKQRFFEYLRSIIVYNKAQMEALPTGESPEFAQYIASLNKLFGSINVTTEQEQIIRIILKINLSFFETIADNNRRLLALIFSDSSSQPE